MPTRAVENESQRTALINLIQAQKLPFTAQITKGKNRSLLQNDLAFKWYLEAAQQLGDRSADEIRAMAKLEIGVPILRRDNEHFREVYDRLLKPLSYGEKLEFIQATDLPITRLMKVKQMVEYLDEFGRKFSAQGVVLTDPEAMKRGET